MKNFFSRLMLRMQISRTISALESLPDSTLHDINLVRSNIKAHVFAMYQK